MTVIVQMQRNRLWHERPRWETVTAVDLPAAVHVDHSRHHLTDSDILHYQHTCVILRSDRTHLPPREPQAKKSLWLVTMWKLKHEVWDDSQCSYLHKCSLFHQITFLCPQLKHRSSVRLTHIVHDAWWATIIRNHHMLLPPTGGALATRSFSVRPVCIAVWTRTDS